MLLFRSLAILCLLSGAANAQQVTPRPCDNTTVAVGGTAVNAIVGPANGYYIVNPLSSGDQGVTAENLYVDPTATATLNANATNAGLAPGQPFNGIANSKASVSVNAPTSGHKFTCVRW